MAQSSWLCLPGSGGQHCSSLALVVQKFDTTWVFSLKPHSMAGLGITCEMGALRFCPHSGLAFSVFL